MGAAVTILAARRFIVPFGDLQPVDALGVLVRLLRMALAAFWFGDALGMGKMFVPGVAFGATCGSVRRGLNRLNLVFMAFFAGIYARRFRPKPGCGRKQRDGQN